MRKVYINGYFTCERTHGIPRYSREIVKRLDAYFKPGEAVLVVPKKAINIPKLENIEISTWESRGKKKEIENVALWGEFVFKKNIEKGCLGVNLSGRPEFVKNSITAIHDVISLGKYEYGFKLNLKEKVKKNIFDVFNRSWCWCKLLIKKYTASRIVTVSEFSKKEICKTVGINKDKIIVIGSGWEHINQIEEMDEKKDERIQTGKYYFTIGNILPHKNLKWIFEEAKTMPNEYFVVAGNIPSRIKESVNSIAGNIIFLDHISDEYLKFLMKNCKALLFPTFIEGFGIPPLEQLALGGEAIVSDIPIMHEIYGGSVHYINPLDGNIDLNKVLEKKRNGKEVILENHSWDLSAKRWFELIESEREMCQR